LIPSVFFLFCGIHKNTWPLRNGCTISCCPPFSGAQKGMPPTPFEPSHPPPPPPSNKWPVPNLKLLNYLRIVLLLECRLEVWFTLYFWRIWYYANLGVDLHNKLSLIQSHINIFYRKWKFCLLLRWRVNLQSYENHLHTEKEAQESGFWKFTTRRAN